MTWEERLWETKVQAEDNIKMELYEWGQGLDLTSLW